MVILDPVNNPQCLLLQSRQLLVNIEFVIVRRVHTLIQILLAQYIG